MSLLGHVRRAIVIRHDPGDGEEGQEEGEGLTPPGAIGEGGEDEFGALELGREREKGDTDAHGCQDIDGREPEDHAVQVATGEGADDAGEYEQADGEEDCLECRSNGILSTSLVSQDFPPGSR